MPLKNTETSLSNHSEKTNGSLVKRNIVLLSLVTGWLHVQENSLRSGQMKTSHGTERSRIYDIEITNFLYSQTFYKHKERKCVKLLLLESLSYW